MHVAHSHFLRRAGLCAVIGLMASLGCRNDSTGPAPIDAGHLYYQLTLNHHAVTLALTAPYDTITLLATPRSATGAPLTDTGTTSYAILGGDTNVTVGPTGIVHALAPDTGGEVVARRTIGSYTLSDTAFISINAVSPVPRFAAFTLRTQPGDSADFTFSPYNATYTGPPPEIIPVALDQYNDTIANVAFRLSSPIDPYIGYSYCATNPRSFNNGPDPATGGCGVNRSRPGKMWIHAEATVYGVSRVDSVLYTVGWPLFGIVNVLPHTPVGRLQPIGVFDPGDDTVAVGAIVVWHNWLAAGLADVVFDNPSAAQGIDTIQYAQNNFTRSGLGLTSNQETGNISGFPNDSTCTLYQYVGSTLCDGNTLVHFVRARQFLQAGTYRYHSALYGTAGVIHVLPESQFSATPQ